MRGNRERGLQDRGKNYGLSENCKLYLQKISGAVNVILKPTNLVEVQWLNGRAANFRLAALGFKSHLFSSNCHSVSNFSSILGSN